MEKLDKILDSRAKLRIIRLFVSRTKEFKATGRQIGRLVGITAPAVHAALKILHAHSILLLDIIGRQHIYSLNTQNKIVKEILVPAFEKENSWNNDIPVFLKQNIRASGLQNKIISIILYGSFQSGHSDDGSDVDIAVVVKNKNVLNIVREKFESIIEPDFYKYFGMHLHPYIKDEEVFTKMIIKKMPPVSSLLESYTVVSGKDPLDMV